MNLLSIIPGSYKKAGSSPARGAEYAGPCPWCGGDDRFRIWPEQKQFGTFWCRQCEMGGDAIHYLREKEGLTYKEACERLGRDPGHYDPSTPAARRTEWQPAEIKDPDQLWMEKAGAFTEWCHGHLLENAQWLAWLGDRGIDREMVQVYKLGLNPKDAWRPRASWGLPAEKKDDGSDKKLWLPAGLVIPCIERFKVQRLRIRRHNPEFGPKYYVVPGSSRQPLVSRSARGFVIVESELDAIALDRAAGDLIGVVALGNSTAKPREPLYSMLKNALHLSVSLDADEIRINERTGKKEAPGAQASKWWLDHFGQAERVPCVGAKDPGEMIAAGRDLRTWIKAALPPVLLIQPAAPAADVSGPDKTADQGAADLELDLEDGTTIHVTTDRKKYQQLIADNKIAFSENELARLQRLTCTMSEDKKGQAVSLITDLKKVFGTAYVRGSRAVRK